MRGQDCNLKTRLLDHERGLIAEALEASGGRQRAAAARLGVRPSTLCEKMKRLGIRRPHQRSNEPSPQSSSTMRWQGPVPPGATLEVVGPNGPVRVEAGGDDRVEVVAFLKGPRELLAAVELKVVEHARGTSLMTVCQGPRFTRLDFRVELSARVPPGVHLVVRTANGDVEVVGTGLSVDASTTNGRVRLQPAPAEVAAWSPGRGGDREPGTPAGADT